MLGTKIYKNNFDKSLYRQCAKWCNNANTAVMKEFEDYYEVVTIEEEPEDELTQKKKLLNEAQAYLLNTNDKIFEQIEQMLMITPLSANGESSISEILSQRSLARERIMQLEAQIKELES